MTLEKEYQSYKENFENSEFFQTIVDYSKDIYDFKKPKISTNIDVRIFDNIFLELIFYSILIIFLDLR